jgi:hypothetical protein
MGKVSYPAVKTMVSLLTILFMVHPSHVSSAGINVASISPIDTTDQETGHRDNNSAAPKQKAPNTERFTPFRHLQAGAAAGLTATRISVSGSPEDAVVRFTFGADIRPLPFLSLKASMSSAKVSDITNSRDTITAQSTVTFRAGTSSNTYFKTYAAGATVILPLRFWQNWPEALSETKKGIFFTFGGLREWITISDHYLVDSLGNSATRTLAEIKGSFKEQRWTGSGGILYRHPLPYPFKGRFEAGADYVHPYKKTAVFSGTQSNGNASPPTAISRTVRVHQDVPVQLKLSLLFKVY